MIEKFAKRTIWEAKCPCGWSDSYTENPPREKQCPECHTWCAYEERSWIGPDQFKS